MPVPVLVKETGAVVPGANSYEDVEGADAYHDTLLYASTWTGATADEKTVALIWATRLLDKLVLWHGTIVGSEQALRWPRTGVETPDEIELPGDEIPEFLRQATAELARKLLGEDLTADKQVGLSSLKVDVVGLVFEKLDRKKTLPQSVYDLVSGYGRVKGRSRIKRLVK